MIAELLLTNLLAYLINLASGERSAAIAASRQNKIARILDENDELRHALASTRNIRDELRAACTKLARFRTRFDVPTHEEPLWLMLADDLFQQDLVEWIMAGSIEEGNEVKKRILSAMERSLIEGGASSLEVECFKTNYFDTIDKTIFSHPILANWRHQLSLNYLRGQVAILREFAEEAAGIYSIERQTNSLNCYCEKALQLWDIIDLSNLPEGDVHMATQQLLLRQLYMPLRIEVDTTERENGDDRALARLEEQREFRRRQEAGHISHEESDNKEISRVSIGERLGNTQRLVVLGDPGSGKTTMLRWMATAYLLRYKKDPAFNQLPDTKSLPDAPWIPVLIRCRDLGKDDLCRSFKDFLTQHLNKSHLLPSDASIMLTVILDRMAKGEAILLIDGLDEITDPKVRMLFCQELEHTSVRYPDAPIVITSRIVGYRDMPYRMGSGFRHGNIAELSAEDKDLFAHRWIEVTEQKQVSDEKNRRVEELLQALHSSNRIERLTGNPMLLTTLALVKRKVGKLPNRRTKLYAEAVSVLLNWNPRLYEAIDDDEAIPQLEYLAYEMCRRGVQRLKDEEVLDLLDKLRVEYPNVRAIRRRTPENFLRQLEERSSILIKSGAIWQKNKQKEEQVWEFRHLTFQEYLAARALLDGKYPGREKNKSLSQQVAPLSVPMLGRKKNFSSRKSENEVPESWREALRLLVADCKDDDVDSVMLTILTPPENEDKDKTARPRAILATLCLADEPNVSEETGKLVLTAFANAIKDEDGISRDATTPLDRAGLEIGGSVWANSLKECLIHEYCDEQSKLRENLGGLWGMIEVANWDKTMLATQDHLAKLAERLDSIDKVESLSAALATMFAAFDNKINPEPRILESLFQMLKGDSSAQQAASWALVWLNGGYIDRDRMPLWTPSAGEAERMKTIFTCVDKNNADTLISLIHILGKIRYPNLLDIILVELSNSDPGVKDAVVSVVRYLSDTKAVMPLLAALDSDGISTSLTISIIGVLGQLRDARAVDHLISRIHHQTSTIRASAITSLGHIKDPRALLPLLEKFDDRDPLVRQATVVALGHLGDPSATEHLISEIGRSDDETQIAIIESLGRLKDASALETIIGMTNHQDDDMKKAAFIALGEIGIASTIPVLMSGLSGNSDTVIKCVIEALAKLKDDSAIAPLLHLFNNAPDDIAVTAGGALCAMGQISKQEGILKFIKSDKSEVRRGSIRAYANLVDFSSRQLLSQHFSGQSPWIDPAVPISDSRVHQAIRSLNRTINEVKRQYEELAAGSYLTLSWID